MLLILIFLDVFLCRVNETVNGDKEEKIPYWQSNMSDDLHHYNARCNLHRVLINTKLMAVENVSKPLNHIFFIL